MSGPTVVVTAVGGGGNGEQIVKALRASSLRYTIVGTDMQPYSKGLYEVDISYLVPAANDPSYLDQILAICRKHEAVALFHGSEPELRVLSSNRDAFAELGIFLPINPARVIDACMDKVQTSALLSDLGFRVPRWTAVRSLADLDSVDMLPAVLKPSVGGGGSMNLFLAQTTAELETFGRYLLGLYPEFIIQEYVGTPQSEYTVGVLHTMDGSYVNSIAIRRHLGTAISTRMRVPNVSGRAELGPTLVISSGFSHGDIGRFPEVTVPSQQIAAALGVQGAVNIQCRMVDGEIHVFEINPRFSGTTSLRAMVGYNEPDVLIRHHVLGEPIEPDFAYAEGTILRGLCETYVSPEQIASVRRAEGAAPR
jgi:carbamoyl-phosphate synthase large subunit